MKQGRIVRSLALAAASVVASIFAVSTAKADIINLTTAGSSSGPTATTNLAIFSTTAKQPTGSGVIHSFVRMGDASQHNGAIIEGYNTDARPVQFDENTSPTFTR